MKREICMHHRGGHIDQRSNFVKDTKNVALTFGGTNNLITLSLSQVLARPIRTLAKARTASPPHLITYALAHVNIRLSMLSAMESLLVFYPHDGDFLQSDNSSF